MDRLVGLVVKASASRAEDSGFESCLRRDLLGAESYQLLKKWHSSGYPAWRLALEGQSWDWLVRCQYTVIGVRRRLWSATQHVTLSEQIRPWDTLTCCWDVKQPTNQILKVVGKAHTHSAPSLSSLPKGAIETVPMKGGRLTLHNQGGLQLTQTLQSRPTILVSSSASPLPITIIYLLLSYRSQSVYLHETFGGQWIFFAGE